MPDEEVPKAQVPSPGAFFLNRGECHLDFLRRCTKFYPWRDAREIA
jgi:hypothetical protein